MRFRWPIRIVLPLCGLAIASLWLGPPRDRESWRQGYHESPPPKEVQDPATDNGAGGRPVAFADQSSISVDSRLIADEPLATTHLHDSTSVAEVITLIPGACGWHANPQDALARQVGYWQDESAHSQPRYPFRPATNRTLSPNRPSPTPTQRHSSPNTRETNTSARNTLSNAQPIEPPSGDASDDAAEDPHLEIFSRSEYPSATECASCHQQIFDEWAISNHAYAAISPMFHKFEQKLNELSQGTVGYFCLRCHAPVATSMGLRRDQAIWDGPRVFREGVTCVACHRVNDQYGKTNGERRMETGPLMEPVYGAGDGAGVAHAIEHSAHFSVKTDPDAEGPGQVIHRQAIQFEQLSRSDFCVSCHQVAVDPGIKLEVVWDQYARSPACKEGISCQDCHMGRVPGVAEGYSIGPAAVVNRRIVNPARRHSNHVFYGPGSSIAHPGIYPQNPDADRWTVNQWLEFDWRAGWGTDEFEDRLEAGEIWASFPPTWDNIDDRYDAREVLDDNLKALEYKDELRRQVMENGSHLDGPFFRREPERNADLHFDYVLTNTNKGHNLPSGSLGAQPQVWLNVVLIGPDGHRRWESGYLDSLGDLADLHSEDVQHGRMAHDDQLFNLQTKFLIANIKGTDREMFLPINIDIDQLPFIRPGPQPVTVLNHPPFIRMEGHSIPPLGNRIARYVVPAEALCDPGVYRLSVRLRSRIEPLYFMRFVGATPEMQRSMIESILDTHEYSVQFVVP